jgi:hypothetical protein
MEAMQSEIDKEMEKFLFNLKKTEIPLLKDLLKKYFQDPSIRKQIKNILELLREGL